MKDEIRELVKETIETLQKEQKLPQFQIPEISVEYSEKEIYGDYSTNIAMEIGKLIKKNSSEIANILKNNFQGKRFRLQDKLDKIEIAEPGFINFFLSKKYLQEQIGEILRKGEKFGKLDIGKNKRIQVEFISANPTGPLTLGNGRGGFCGDVLANVLNKAGYEVEREYYINDVGEQIRRLGHSVIGDEQAVYKGEYIKELRKRIKEKEPEKVGQAAAKIVLEEIIKPSVKKMGINFDVWFSEKSLYEKKEVEKMLSWLKENKLAYEKEGALWFKSSKFGDEKDRVLVKADGEKTYFASDIAYLKNKFERGFDYLIYIWGADHYGYIKRMEAAAEALGYRKEQIKIIIMQLVRLLEDGQPVRMSKRKGTYITIDELVDEIGLDVARFFFLQRNPGSHLNFDFSLAKEKSEKNPVYYVQYAFARICSILAKLKNKEQRTKNKKSSLFTVHYSLLNHSSELSLIKQLIRFPEIIEDTAKDCQVQRFPQYAQELAASFHQFYRDCRVLTENKELSEARLNLILATKIVLKNVLDIMGISAPEKM